MGSSCTTQDRCLQVFGGLALATFKLHLAAFHLPDQVRACGASFFMLEYWVERLVQLYKRMVKYRSTAFPELIFINSYLLHQACMNWLHRYGVKALVTMEEAVDRAREERRTRKRRRPEAADEFMLGAPQQLTDEERLAVLPSHDGVDDLTGLPYLLYSDNSLHEKGWPVGQSLLPGSAKVWHILNELGLSAGGEAGRPEVHIELQKYVRAELPVGDTVSCVQCTTQQRKDNSWCYVLYTTPGGEELHYVGQFQYFVLARYVTANGWNRARNHDKAAEPLRLAVLNLYTCEAVYTPGVREPDVDLGRPAEFVKIVHQIDANGQVRLPFEGQWVVELETLRSQVVPTRATREGRYFMWANKASGRTGAIKVV